MSDNENDDQFRREVKKIRDINDQSELLWNARTYIQIRVGDLKRIMKIFEEEKSYLIKTNQGQQIMQFLVQCIENNLSDDAIAVITDKNITLLTDDNDNLLRFR